MKKKKFGLNEVGGKVYEIGNKLTLTKLQRLELFTYKYVQE